MRVRRALIAALVLVFAASLTACGSKKAGTGVITPAVGQAGHLATDSIQAARASSADFKIFPRRAASVACQIPRGGPYVPGKMRLDGTCTTQLRSYHPPKGIQGGHGTVRTVEVVFTERWHYPAGSKRSWRSIWIVLVRNDRVLKADTRSTGATPPQSWI